MTTTRWGQRRVLHSSSELSTWLVCGGLSAHQHRPCCALHEARHTTLSTTTHRDSSRSTDVCCCPMNLDHWVAPMWAARPATRPAPPSNHPSCDHPRHKTWGAAAGHQNFASTAVWSAQHVLCFVAHGIVRHPTCPLPKSARLRAANGLAGHWAAGPLLGCTQGSWAAPCLSTHSHMCTTAALSCPLPAARLLLGSTPCTKLSCCKLVAAAIRNNCSCHTAASHDVLMFCGTPLHARDQPRCEFVFVAWLLTAPLHMLHSRAHLPTPPRPPHTRTHPLWPTKLQQLPHIPPRQLQYNSWYTNTHDMSNSTWQLRCRGLLLPGFWRQLAA